jgi:hypothetical protein
MEEMEDPTERVQEEMHEHAHHAPQQWISQVALSAAILAALAAVTSLLSGHHANEAMVDRIRASDQWSYFQAKGIKAAVHGSRVQLLMALGKPVDEKDEQKVKQYEQEQDEIKKEAEEHEADSEAHLHKHVVFARGVTLFQVAIAVAAITVLTKRRRFWLVSIFFGNAGIFFLIQGVFFR